MAFDNLCFLFWLSFLRTLLHFANLPIFHFNARDRLRGRVQAVFRPIRFRVFSHLCDTVHWEKFDIMCHYSIHYYWFPTTNGGCGQLPFGSVYDMTQQAQTRFFLTFSTPASWIALLCSSNTFSTITEESWGNVPVSSFEWIPTPFTATSNAPSDMTIEINIIGKIWNKIEMRSTFERLVQLDRKLSLTLSAHSSFHLSLRTGLENVVFQSKITILVPSSLGAV